jgi:hypothetical protein
MPFCPTCKYEYRPDVKTCPDCDVKLVDELPVDEPREQPPGKLVCVASFPYEVTAQGAKIKLESHGIRAVLTNEVMSQTDIILAWADGGVKVLVSEEDAHKAVKILESD